MSRVGRTGSGLPAPLPPVHERDNDSLRAARGPVPEAPKPWRGTGSPERLCGYPAGRANSALRPHPRNGRARTSGRERPELGLWVAAWPLLLLSKDTDVSAKGQPPGVVRRGLCGPPGLRGSGPTPTYLLQQVLVGSDEQLLLFNPLGILRRKTNDGHMHGSKQALM